MTTAKRPRDTSGWRAVGYKLLLGLGVFGTIVGGWTAINFRITMHSPLPDAGGRQGRCVLWFVGSSSFHRWTTLAADMAPWISHNRGVDGAFLPELRRRFTNEDVPVPPEAIVFYGGDNDIAKGQSAADTLDQFRQFVAAKMDKMPDVPMLVISVKPSPARWPIRGIQRSYDDGIRAMAASDHRLTFIDATPGLLIGGHPGPFFKPDGLHLNPDGYRVWARVTRQTLAASLPRAVVDRCTGSSPPRAHGG